MSSFLVRDNTKEEINRVIRLIQQQTATQATPTPATPASFGNFFSPSTSSGGSSLALNLTSYKIYPLLTDSSGNLSIDSEGFLQLDPVFVAKVV